MKDLRKICVLLVAALLCASAALAQAVNGTIVGTVTDASGAAVVGAKVTLTEINTRILHTGLSNESGAYGFPELPPGTYDVSAEMAGFKREIKTGVILEANSSPRIDLRLEPGAVSETVEVTAGTMLLQTERTDTGRTIDAQMVEELPLGVNRNFQRRARGPVGSEGDILGRGCVRDSKREVRC